MSEQSGFAPQIIAASTDAPSRRHLVTGAAVVAALGGATAEALAQGAPGAAGNLRFLNPPTSYANPGFHHAVEAMGPGRIVFIAGQQGRDLDNKIVGVPGDFLAQAEQAFRNIESALRQAGSSLADVVRVTYILPNAEEFQACWPVLRRYFGDSRPAATMISAGLVDKRLRIEIEVTARIRGPAHT